MSDARAASPCAVAYIPVLHEGYRRFVERHARGGRLFVVGRDLYADYRPLAKDIRALDPELVARAIAAWEICAEVAVLDAARARALAAERATIAMPAEDVSYRLAERCFAGCEVRFDTVFLRWDKTRTAQLLAPVAQRAVPTEETVAELARAAHAEAAQSIDWWRRVGAALRLADGEVLAAHNVHEPHELSAYAAGDPRANFHKGVALELSTATHAEARLIAQAAREGRVTAGAVLYVTDFPCPPCAKLIAGAGIARLYFSEGYAVLDGQEILERAGVELVQLT
jgi:dCMP deaminase